MFKGSVFSLALLIGACADPPTPPPIPSSSGSSAPWVEWRAPDGPVRGPVALVVDRPGGPIDRLVADPDVTTFLNDRFHPLFQTTSASQPVGTVRFYDGCGCPLSPPLTPASPAELIERANEVIVRPDALACQGRPFASTCMAPTRFFGAD
ncbi:MAG: hypothetical protein Q8P41_04405 [Pseudomonadota bacterium]|nr:hypothetical protein [Pseudomonadota bacterium]